MADIDDMKKTNELFKKKLKGLMELSDYGNGKLGVYNNETYVSWNHFQGLQRRFYGENINSLIVFLNNTIDDYCIFYNMILFFLMLYSYSNKMEKITDDTTSLYNSDDEMIKAHINVKLSKDDFEMVLFLKNENEKNIMRKIYNGLIVLRNQYKNNDTHKNIDILVKKIHDLLIIFSH